MATVHPSCYEEDMSFVASMSLLLSLCGCTTKTKHVLPSLYPFAHPPLAASQRLFLSTLPSFPSFSSNFSVPLLSNVKYYISFLQPLWLLLSLHSIFYLSSSPPFLWLSSKTSTVRQVAAEQAVLTLLNVSSPPFLSVPLSLPGTCYGTTYRPTSPEHHLSSPSEND